MVDKTSFNLEIWCVWCHWKKDKIKLNLNTVIKLKIKVILLFKVQKKKNLISLVELSNIELYCTQAYLPCFYKKIVTKIFKLFKLEILNLENKFYPG